MIIYIDGPDFAGKTTAIKQLYSIIPNSVWIHFPIRSHRDHSNGLQVLYFDGELTQDNILRHLYDNEAIILELSKTKCVLLDRYIVSNIIYRELFNARPLSTVEKSLLFNMYAHAKIFILVAKDVNILLQRKQSRNNIPLNILDETLEASDNIIIANRLYDTFCDEKYMKKIYIDSVDVASYILDSLKE